MEDYRSNESRALGDRMSITRFKAGRRTQQQFLQSELALLYDRRRVASDRLTKDMKCLVALFSVRTQILY